MIRWLVVFFCLLAFAVQAEESTHQKKVLLMMSGHAAKAKGDLLESLAADQPFKLERFNAKGKSDAQIAEEWGRADLILLDGINPALSGFMFGKYQPMFSQFPDVPVVSLGDPQNTAMNQGLNAEQQSMVTQYFNNAGRGNYRNLMLYLSSQIFGLTTELPAAPVSIPDVGLYHPDFPHQVSDDEQRFFASLNLDKNLPLVGIAIHRSVVDYEQQQIVDAMIRGIESKGGRAFGFFFEGEDQALNYTELLQDEQGNTRADLLINYRSLHYVEKRRKEFELLGVPVLHALNYTEGDEAAFSADHAGISPGLTPFFLVMPEDTGSADPQIIAASKDGRKVVMQAQMNALVERAFNHANLKHINNADKKVATFIWNYPPGEKNIGAAFLDVPASIAEIARAMHEQGYQVDTPAAQQLIDAAGQLLRPYYRNEDTEGLVEKGLADYLPLQTYLAWFNRLPESVRAPIVERWGDAQDSHMLTVHNGQPHFVIPRMQLGNLIVLPQGVRGETAKEHAASYHSTKTPINHSYLAIYLYARQVFGANALIHLGTHGSQEWLMGKERGLSVFDAPNLAIGNLPVFYPYIIDNVGEAMQAKRRGRATMLSHLTPGFAKAGLYADVAKLNELINNHLMLDQGQTRDNTRDKIIQLADELNILADLALTKQQLAGSFEEYLSRIQDHLTALSEQSQPLGVHTFGLLPQDAHLYSTILQILGESFMQQAAEYEQQQGLTLPAALRLDKNAVLALEAIDGFQLLHAFITGQPTPNLTASLTTKLNEAREHWDNFQQIAEVQNLLKALSGQYIPVSHGGDPIRNPQAAPTGRNLIGFNPSKVPSPEAYQAGVAVMKQTIADYVAKHGRYPQKLAFSLWSLETMRHQGALEAQILYALGVKPVWNAQGQMTDTEIIPYSELKRPRIDVVVSATGLYRDAFPNVMLWLADAIDKIAKLKEENNFVYKHTSALKTQLLASGKTDEDADYLSSVRIFSNQSGAYGTGLAGKALASDTWEDDSDMAQTYLRRMGFAFGKDETRWSENVEDAQLYAKVLSGTDAVIFSRSTNLYALMTNDDPFQYFGGVGLAVRHLDGQTPEMYVSNLRRVDDVKSQTMTDFLNQEMRSRYFHPRWIGAMQEAGYAGATAILDRMNNMWGWEVMTPEAVRDDQWQEFFDVYVDDKYQLDMKAFFEKHNADALAQMLERMLEAVRKGYWQADAQTLKRMLEEYQDLASRYDVFTNNQKFKDFVARQAAGFGLAPLVSAPSAANEAIGAKQVQGQELKEVQKDSTVEPDYRAWYLIGTIFLLGMVSPYLQRQPRRLAAVG
ncbi:cobaltochelatase subunit CobN [Bowmanella yangjiangensis]|uniref:Cobaltochelatase subunit CobN n=1 Tax=Bowmanella yangjiangensis TaxID=2811230 RepID=A0ABS3CUP0_9ALTE|nr:cobaltochelatase subunit CobN [Bowmanella yangjiangensis]MBN7819354.1 cobaltochelatase subunit CobN [Bowmanella yangjiangensis]